MILVFDVLLEKSALNHLKQGLIVVYGYLGPRPKYGRLCIKMSKTTNHLVNFIYLFNFSNMNAFQDHDDFNLLKIIDLSRTIKLLQKVQKFNFSNVYFF